MSDGQWSIGRKSSFVIAGISEPVHPSWLTILEKPIDSLNADLEAKITKFQLPISLHDLPMKKIAIAGLKSGHSEWVRSALEWTSLDTIDDQYREALEIAAKSPGAGQKNRQYAWRLLAKSGSQNSGE